MLQTFKDVAEPFVESSILVQRLGQWTLKQLPFLLPHNADFIGLQFLRPTDPHALFIDVGANCGLSALSIRKYHPQASILSLEPFKYHERSLRAIQRRDPYFQYRMVGLSDEAAQCDLVVARSGPLYFHSMAFLDFDGDELERRRGSEKPKSEFYRKFVNQVEKVPVDLVTLDSLEKNPYFIKIDAEGHELPILKGGRKTLESYRPTLLLEYDKEFFESTCAYLNALDYRCLYFDHKSLTFKSTGDRRNIYFIPAERLSDLPIEASV